MARIQEAHRPRLAKNKMNAQSTEKLGKDADGFGEDPWMFINDPDDNVAKTKTSTPPPTDLVTSDTEDDQVAAPIPIHGTQPCKIIAADGREEVIYTPISGFEHLFKTRDSVQEARPSIQPSKPHHASSNSSQKSHGGESSRAAARTITTTPKATVAKAWKRRPLKRSRSVAQSLSKPLPSSKTTSDDDGEDTEEDDDEDKDVKVVTEASRSFRMGDMKGLKHFLRYRLDELTMKPLRPIVTAWIKQLEPRRLGGYGPYHKCLPSEAPNDATPPWWPHNVRYNEPSHLAKTDLLNLAIDVILQHRPLDEVKRRGSWTAKLRQAAEYAVEMTEPESFSSSVDPGFSVKMRDRALNLVLPSLFDVIQSYEDYVFQYTLWDHAEDLDVPKGQTYSWQPVPRPARQPAQRKRSRRGWNTVIKVESDVDAHTDNSGDETEVDQTMLNMAKKQSRQNAERTRLSPKVKDEARVSESSQPRVIKPSTPALAPAAAPLATAPQSTSENTSPNSSFGQSMTHLHLYEDTKGGNFVTSDNHSRQNSMMPLSQTTQYHNSLDDYNHAALQRAQATGQFVRPEQMVQAGFAPPMPQHSAAFQYNNHGVLYTNTSADGPQSFNGLPYSYNIGGHEQQPL